LCNTLETLYSSYNTEVDENKWEKIPQVSWVPNLSLTQTHGRK